MIFLILTLSFQLSAQQADDSLLVKQTQRQVRQYVKNVQKSQNTAINLWALAAVAKARPEIQDYLNKYATQRDVNESFFNVLRDSTLSYRSKLYRLAFRARSPLLLAAYLLEESYEPERREAARRYSTEIGYPPDRFTNHKKIIQSILNNEPVTDKMLPAERFHPFHYFLFYHSAQSLGDIFSSSYLSQIKKNWPYSGSPLLNESMKIAVLFKVYYYLFEYNKTHELYRPVLNNFVLPNYSTKLQILRALDYSMYRLGYYQRSINIMNGYAIPLANYLRQFETAIKMKISQGSNLFEIGKYEASKSIYLTVLEKGILDTLSVSKARIYNNLASNYYKTGKINKYYSLIFKALKKTQQEENLNIQLDVLANLFTTYRKNQDFESARAYLKKAQKVALKLNDQQEIAKLIYYEGLLYKDLRLDFEYAISSFKEALTHLSPQKNYLYFQEIETEIAFLLEEQGRDQKALNRYNQIIARAQKRDDLRNILQTTVHKANIFLNTGRRDSVEVMLKRMTSHNLSILNFDHIVKAKTVRAKYLIKRNRPEEAYALLKPALEQVVRRSRAGGDLKTGFWQVEPEYLNAFEVMANLLINTGRPEDAVEVLDRLKTINDAKLYQNPLARSQVLNEKELSLYKRLTKQLNGLRKQLLTATGEQKRDIQLQIDKLSAKKRTLDLKVTTQAALQPVSIDEVQRRLSARERILHITELNDTYYLALTSRTSVQFNKIQLDKKLRSLFEKNIALLASGNTDLNLLYRITKLLDINALPEHINKLIIMPDSYLYQLPLAVLPLERPSHSYSYGSASYLTERFKTVYKTSLSDFSYASSRNEAPLDFVGFGVSKFNKERTLPLTPLPRADNEIKSIKNQLSRLNEKKVLLNNSATEESFKRFAPEAQILHLATHSTVSHRNPLFSSIYLSASGEGGDNEQYSGRIFAYELFELNLSSALIMLNSCESASGSYLQGSGVVGISRALRFAGAETLVLNVWPVNDAPAAQFAVKFYEMLNKGFSKDEALRRTRLWSLEHGNADPYYWGSYMLLGNTEAIVRPDRTANSIAAASFLAFFLVFAVASSVLEWRRRNS